VIARSATVIADAKGQRRELLVEVIVGRCGGGGDQAGGEGPAGELRSSSPISRLCDADDPLGPATSGREGTDACTEDERCR